MTNHLEAINPECRIPGPEPPQIYVASLSDYNRGNLHGAWIDAAREDEEVWGDVHEMLNASPQVDAEEFAIHDYGGFAGWRVDEYESIPVVTTVARAIAEHGPAVASWIAHRGEATSETIEKFAEAYLGEWATMNAYAEHLVEDLGVTIDVEPQSWAHYVKFDTEQLARDLDIELASSESPDGGLFVFDPNVD